jgi:hypothetical protein
MSFTLPKRETLGVFVAVALAGGATPAMAQEADGIRYDQIPAGAYVVVAEVRAKPGREDELIMSMREYALLYV